MRLKRGNKYGARRVNGYASKREAKRAQELRLLEQANVITGLTEQPVFELIPKQVGERPCVYIADFAYFEDGKPVVEDVKGVRTDVYRLKRKLLLWVHGIRVREVA